MWEGVKYDYLFKFQLIFSCCQFDVEFQVSKSDCGSQKGMKGICLLETKHTLQIISTDNKLRLVGRLGEG